MSKRLRATVVTAARARGVPARLVVLRHALRKALGPIVTIVLLDSALMVSGAVSPKACLPGLASAASSRKRWRDATTRC